MPDHSVPLDESPERRIQIANERFGEAVVADRAAALLDGANEGEEFLLWVGGRHAQGILDGAPALYWPEVWGARALLYAWDAAAAASLERGLGNQAWRVREMCARVVATRGLPLAESLVTLLRDENPRVRAMAARALGRVGESAHTGALTTALKDPEVDVRRQAGESLRLLDRSERPADERPAE